jgi:hypothetical protein
VKGLARALHLPKQLALNLGRDPAFPVDRLEHIPVRLRAGEPLLRVLPPRLEDRADELAGIS